MRTVIESEPVSFVRDQARRNQAGSLVMLDTCISLDVLASLSIGVDSAGRPRLVRDRAPGRCACVFTYYLRHRAGVEDYFAAQEREGAEIQERIQAGCPLGGGLPATLLARLET